MKKIIAFILLLTLLAPMLPARAETVAVKPYYGIGSSDFNRTKFPNLEGRLTVSVGVENENVYLAYSGAGKDINKIAASVKTALDDYPEGMRSLVLFRIADVFQLQEDTIFFEEGVGKLKTLFSEFIKAYAEIGGKLDSIVLDLEYVDTYAWYLYSKQYTKGNQDVYKNIVENPLYETEVRPLLVERGFKFYADASKPEIWSIYPSLKGAEAEEYAISQTVWGTVMRIRLNNYLTEAIYEPLMQYMPDTRVYDYQSRDTYAWLKDLTDKGEHNYVAGNSVAVGATSHHNTYGSRLSDAFFTVDDQPVYNTPVAYNGAEFAATPFNRILWDVNLMKNMYKASGGDISVTVAEYDYSPNKVGTPSNTPYYTEAIFHIGLLDPEPFNIYMYDKAFETTAAYNKRAKVLQEIMAELTRVAGYADREPILVPATWNSSFLLSGIYANGRNLWRFTPDSDKVDPATFLISEDDPTFYINGQTITFPQGKIIPDGSVSVVGTYGYWIETPKDVAPIVTNDTDRYSRYPSYEENFESYADGAAFTTAAAQPAQCWNVNGDAPKVENGALALLGTATLDNVNLPKNITAGDYYAKEQAWEISVTLSETMSGGSLQLLMTPGDGGFKIEDGKVSYCEGATARGLSGVTLKAGEKYTFKREMDFDAFTCTYSVYAGDKLLGQAADVKIDPVALPVDTVSFSCFDLTAKVLLDDYKLYPTGITAELEVYNAETGIRQEDITQKSSTDVAYRLSWLNGSEETENMVIMATFYGINTKTASQEVIQKVQMNPGSDGVETGIVEVPEGQKVVLTVVTPEPAAPTKPTTKPTAAPTVKPAQSQTTTKPTAEPTQAQTTAPGTETVKPAAQQSITVPTTKPIVQQIVKPTSGPSAEPTEHIPNGPTQAPTEQTQSPSATAPVTLPTGEGVTAEMTVAPTQVPTNGETDPVATKPEKPETPQEDPDGKGNSGWVLWAVIAVVTLSGAGAAAYFLYFKKRHNRSV